MINGTIIMSDSDCPYKLEPQSYDMVMAYCRERQNSLLVNNIKLDCSNMDSGMDSWYENNSLSDGDGHPRKF